MYKTRDLLETFVLPIYVADNLSISRASRIFLRPSSSRAFSLAKSTRIASFVRLGLRAGANYRSFLSFEAVAVMCPAAFAIKSDFQPCLLQLLPLAHPKSWRFLAASRSRSRSSSELARLVLHPEVSSAEEDRQDPDQFTGVSQFVRSRP